jgi:hypothetical protein
VQFASVQPATCAQVLSLLREAVHGLGNGADIADDRIPAAFDLLNNPSRCGLDLQSASVTPVCFAPC